MSSDRPITSSDDHTQLCVDVPAAVCSRAPLLISGERHVARLVAGLVHERSGRRGFVRVPPKALAEGLAAFGAGLDGGSTPRRDLAARDERWTLFIEDIHQLTPAAQERLFHSMSVLYSRDASASPEQGSPVVRVMGASALDLSLAVTAGTFRQDLFYRLATIHLTLPSVGAENEDPAALVDLLLRATAGSIDPDSHPLSVQDLERLVTTEPDDKLRAWQSLLTSLR